MLEQRMLRRGTVLEPLVRARLEERLCVLMNDATEQRVRLCIAHRDPGGHIHLTDEEFILQPSALDVLRPVEGVTVGE